MSCAVVARLRLGCQCAYALLLRHLTRGCMLMMGTTTRHCHMPLHYHPPLPRCSLQALLAALSCRSHQTWLPAMWMR